MKTTILLLLITLSVIKLNAQNPDITGDTLLCPNSNGTAYVIDPVYDNYQWYYKYWFTTDDFIPIDGATDPVFVYDWFTYDQALLKVVVELNGQVYESDTLQIDSYAWLPIYYMAEMGEGVTYDPLTEIYTLEPGAVLPVSINNPPYDTLIQWYKDGNPIPGADTSSYVITSEGTYWATAAPSFCPNNSSTTFNIVVAIAVKVPVVDKGSLKIYPNPAAGSINLEVPGDKQFTGYSIIDLSGKVLRGGNVSGTHMNVSLNGLEKGHYLFRLDGINESATGTFIVN